MLHKDIREDMKNFIKITEDNLEGDWIKLAEQQAKFVRIAADIEGNLRDAQRDYAKVLEFYFDFYRWGKPDEKGERCELTITTDTEGQRKAKCHPKVQEKQKICDILDTDLTEIRGFVEAIKQKGFSMQNIRKHRKFMAGDTSND